MERTLSRTRSGGPVPGLCVALLVAAAPAPPQERPLVWGGDVNRDSGGKLVESVARELRGFVKLPATARPKRAAELARTRASAAIEGWKRYRDPELIDLARACLSHPEWRVVHRALLWARALGDPALFESAWALIDHPQPRLRERAAVSCLESWRAPQGGIGAGGAAAASVSVRLAAEQDFHVRQILHALQRRCAGGLEPRQAAREVVVKRRDGLSWAPYVRRLSRLAEVAPGVTVTPSGEPGGGSAAALPVVERWFEPLLGYGREEVPGIVLQPFGKERQEGELVHTGQDVGGCLDGAGFYAIGSGVVRWITSGSDMGVGIVVEHHRAPGELVNAVYMHAGGTIFVEVGEQVEGGQLLATMGLSFSVENGGQFAHLHFGLYPGRFDVAHNYGYKPAAAGISDWLDPADCLPRWIAGTAGAARSE